MLAAALVTAPVAIVAGRALGGVTGDVLGAIEQVVECTVLVVVSGPRPPPPHLVELDADSADEGRRGG